MTRPAVAVMLASLALAACAPEAPALPFRVVPAPGDDPFLGADALVIALERDGVLVAGTEARFPPDARSVELASLPFGERMTLRVEALFGDLVLARGRSLPFDYASADAPPDRSADVLLGTLGVFAETVQGPIAIPLAIAPTARGAILATDAEVLEYVAHSDEDGSARLRPLAAHDAERTGALWIATGDRLLAIGPTGAVLVDESGATTGRWSEVRDARAACTLADGTVVALLAGGQVVRIDVSGTAPAHTVASVSAIAPQLVTVSVQVGDAVEERVVLVDVDRAILIDPSGAPGAPMPELALAPPRTGRVLAAVGVQELVVAGGRDELGVVTDEAFVLLVDPDRDPALAVISPPPDRLATARAGGVTAPLGRGLVLVAGGVGDAGSPLSNAEILDYDPLPGESAQTRPLPFDGAALAAARLRDRTAIVASPDGIAIYFPPRE